MAYDNRNQSYQKNNDRNNQSNRLEFTEKQFDQKWIKEQLNEEAIKFAELFANFLVSPPKKDDKLSTSQIRNIFSEIKNIEQSGYAKNIERFALLKAKMAYVHGRNNKDVIREFRRIFDLAHKEVNDEKTFERFVSFITAILAYHRAAGGK